jgi:hypothetical protein
MVEPTNQSLESLLRQVLANQQKILALLKPREPAHFKVTLGVPTKRGIPMANFQLADDQKVTVTATGVDDQGNSVPLPAGATATWGTSDPTVLVATQDPTNPLAVSVATTGKVATGQQLTLSVQLPGTPTPPPIVVPPAMIDVIPSALVGAGFSFGTPTAR